MDNSLFTIAIVSIVFKPKDFHSKWLGLGKKIKLNGRRMYMFCIISFSARLVDFDNILIFFCWSNTKPVPVHTEKSYHYLNVLLQTSINVSDNNITIVLQW